MHFFSVTPCMFKEAHQNINGERRSIDSHKKRSINNNFKRNNHEELLLIVPGITYNQ
jgi:hypothetical protein